MEVKLCRSQVGGTISAPASKSYAQRAVAAALLAHGTSTLTGMELSDDTRAALSVAEALGATVSSDGDTYTIDGGLSPRSNMIDIGESGLSTRLFTPIAALCDRPLTITGHGSILKRPVSMMEQPLRDLGAEVGSTGGFLPVTVRGPLLGGTIEADGSLSSQFITGLLTALPLAKRDTVLEVASLNSKPYIDMTLEVLEQFGIEIMNDSYRRFTIRGCQTYHPAHYHIEGDWSGASTLLVAGAMAGEITINNLNPRSRQADKAILDALMAAGASVSIAADSVTVRRAPLRAFMFDATHCPDLFPALVALAACCDGETALAGTMRLQHKESDRAATLAAEFGKMGIEVDISQTNIMRVRGGQATGAAVDSHNDHRIAMATAVAALTANGTTTISRAEAVNKSYPDFWEVMKEITNY